MSFDRQFTGKRKIVISFALVLVSGCMALLSTPPFLVLNEKTPKIARRLSQIDCDDFDGILFISRVIRKAGAGTMFFQSLIDSLLYAEKYNLYPFIWINDRDNEPCYDPNVHGVGPNVTYQHLTGRISNLIGDGDMQCDTKTATRPGPPMYDSLKTQNITLVGNGLWQSYFEPISANPFASCASKPVFQMSKLQVMPDMHRCSEFAVRGWAFKGIPQALLPNDLPVADWLYSHRQRAAGIVRRHFSPQPWLLERVREAIGPAGSSSCLAAHIRLTDKASGRDKKGLDAYRPYLEAFAAAAAPGRIYVATDDATVATTIQEQWERQTSDRIIAQPGAFRSGQATIPTFQLLQHDKHRSNTEALVDMYAMAQCSYFVHGYSGMAEAVVYINPKLHTRSVNIDDPDKMSPTDFQNLVQTLEKQKQS